MNKKSIYQKLLRTAATLAGTNMKRRAVMLGVVVMTMIALPTKVLADDYVASVTIGTTTTNYATLPDAVTAANAATNDVTVTLLGDVNLGSSAIEFTNTNTVSGSTEKVALTIDLKGNNLSGNGAQVSSGFHSLIQVSENTKLNIIDSSNGGSITSGSIIINSGSLNIYGGTFNGISSGEIIVNHGGTLNFFEGTIGGTYSAGIWSDGGKLNISGGTFTGSNINTDMGVTVANSQTTISGGNFSGFRDGIFIESGTLTFSQGTISNCKCGLSSDDDGVMNISGGSFSDCSEAAISINGITTFSGLPTFGSGNNANACDINLAPTDDLIYNLIGFNEGIFNIPEGFNKIKVRRVKWDNTIPGIVDDSLPYVFTKGYKAAFTDGKTGATVDPADVFTVSGANIVLAGGEAIAYDPDKPLVVVNTDADGDIEKLYTVDGTTYTTEGDALRATVNALADGETLTLCKDVDLGDNGMYLWIKKGTAAQPVTIDLNGKKITVKREDCVLVVGDGNSTPTVIIKNGTIENSHTETGHGIMNYGNLTISGVSATGYDAIVNTGTGTLSIASGTITANGSNGVGLDNSGTLTMSGGSVTGYYGIRNLGILTVSGGTVEGKGSFAIENYSNAISCTIGAATIKSDNNLGIKAEVNVTLTAWPAFSGNSTDIDLADVKIVLGDGFAVPATEFNKMKVKAAGDVPITITSGYAAHCKDAQSNVIAPASVFTWTGEDGYAILLDGDEVKVKNYTEITLERETIEMEAGDESYSGATLTPAAAGNLVYTSDDEHVATVSEGVITAVGVGSCNIMVSFPGNDSYAPAESKAIAVSVGWPSMPITLPAGLSTYYESAGLRVSNAEGNGEGVKMYAVTAVSDDQVTLKEISSRTIPKNTPVIISNANNSEVDCLFEYPYDADSENQFAQTFSTDMGTAITAPEFTGTAIGKTGYNPPVTLYGFNGAAFVKMDGPVDIAAHRCWIEIGDAMTIGGARKLSIVFDDETTGIKEVKEVKEVKADTWYTIGGRKLEKAPSRKGIYIQRSTFGRLQGKNGKKHVIK